MSVRDLPEDRNDSGGRWEMDLETIEREARNRGLEDDIDDVVVEEGANKQGDETVTFRVYTKKVTDGNGNVDEAASVGAQVVKMPELETADGTFKNDVQNTLDALKRHLYGDEEDEDLPEPDRERSTDDGGTATQDPSGSAPTTEVSGDGPGATIDGQIQDHEARISDLEDRIEELEEYVDALEGLKQLMGGDDG